MALRVGDPAPEIDVEYWERGAHDPASLNLTGYRGKWVVLFFYPRDFTFICPTEISAFAALQDEFDAEGASLIAASTDSFFSHDAWFRQEDRLQDVDFPVIADASHAFAEAFNVLLDDGSALRATFIIDPLGIIRHMSANEIDIGRNVDETLRILRALKSGELCPAGWQPGSDEAHSYNEWLAQVFPRLSKDALEDASGSLQTVIYHAGDIIVRQGDHSDRFFIIVDGEVVVVHLKDDGEEVQLATLGAGDMFGEMGILMETRRTADVRADTDVNLLALDWNGFKALVDSSQQTANDFMRIVEQRRTRSQGAS